MKNCTTICYHRILEGFSKELYTIEAYQYQRNILHSLADFRNQLDLLQDKCTIVDAEEFIQCRAGKILSKPAVLLTFDDGYEDFATTVIPELYLRGLPCVLFPTKAPVTQRFTPPADQVYAILATDFREQQRLTTEQRKSWVEGDSKKKLLSANPAEQAKIIIELANLVGVFNLPEGPRHLTETQINNLPDSVYLGAHGLYHHEFGSLTSAELTNELNEILNWVQHLRPKQKNGVWLAYPNGKSDRSSNPGAVTKVVADAGVDFAFTASFEFIDNKNSNLSIPRIFSKNGIDWLRSIWQ